MLSIVVPIPRLVNIYCLQISQLESESYRNQKFYSRIGIRNFTVESESEILQSNRNCNGIKKITVESESYWNQKKFRYRPITGYTENLKYQLVTSESNHGRDGDDQLAR